MSEGADPIKTFMEGWKPFAALPPGNLVRRSLLRFMATEDGDQRREIFAKANGLYKLHRTYEALGILRTANNAKSEVFDRMIGISTSDFAAAIKNKQPKDYLLQLQEAFEFGRSPAASNQLAVRQFLSHFWALKPGAPSLKYTIYGNGVLFSTGGGTHEEMTKAFTDLGFGSGRPAGGGAIIRNGDLDFDYDTYSKAVQSGGSARQLVGESLNRWIRATGADETRVKLTYHENVASS